MRAANAAASEKSARTRRLSCMAFLREQVYASHCSARKCARRSARVARCGRIMANRWRRTFSPPRSGIFPAMARTVAIVEDDPAIRANYADMLRRHGYEVAAYGDRAAAMSAFRQRMPDLALLDIGLPGEPDGGFTLCRELRALSAAVPIIFLTARDSDFDVISGLRMGADDYLTKDAGLPHLLARISALFRRADLLHEAPVEEEILERGALRMDMKRFLATWGGQPVELT